MKLPAASCGVSLERNCAEAPPAFALTSYGAVAFARILCSKLQSILAKANERTGKKGDLVVKKEFRAEGASWGSVAATQWKRKGLVP
jgi:hypothetical protein